MAPKRILFPPYAQWGLPMKRARIMATRRAFRAGASRVLASRAYTGGALAAGALAGYGAYRGIKAIRARRARMRKRRTIGFKPKTKGTKALENIFDMSVKDTRTLYQDIMTNISKGTAASQRYGDKVNIKGWRLHMHFQSLNNVSNQVINVAIITPKAGLTLATGEFFRGYSSDRASAFGTALDFIRLTETPINADQYNVLHRWRFRLGHKVNNGGTSEITDKSNSYKDIKKWIPFKRQLRYERDDSVVESDPVFLVYWSDIEYSTSGGSVVTSAFQCQYRFITFFNDDGCC